MLIMEHNLCLSSKVMTDKQRSKKHYYTEFIFITVDTCRTWLIWNQYQNEVICKMLWGDYCTNVDKSTFTVCKSCTVPASTYRICMSRVRILSKTVTLCSIIISTWCLSNYKKHYFNYSIAVFSENQWDTIINI